MGTENRGKLYVILLLLGVGLCVILGPSWPAESYRRPSWGSDPISPLLLPPERMNELDQPNPLVRPRLPPVNGGRRWIPPPIAPAYANAVSLYCGLGK